MQRLVLPGAVVVACLVALPAGAALAQEHAHTATPAAAAGAKYAIAVLSPTAGNACHGIVRFTEDGATVKVVADIEGLTPGQQHAIHIHDFGDCSAPDATSAGSHYNPAGHPHGLPTAAEHHAGDLGNLTADKDGKSHYEITLDDVSLMGATNPIVGRGVIVHAKIDDGGQPVGNAGARLACGTIGVAKPPEAK